MQVETALVTLTVLLVGGWAWAGNEDTNQPPQALRLELDLVDGSRLIGTPAIESVPVQTAYAKMDIPLKQVLSLKIGDDHETVALDLVNGDKLQGVVTLKPLELTTLIGPVKIRIEHIRMIRVLQNGMMAENDLVVSQVSPMSGCKLWWGDGFVDGWVHVHCDILDFRPGPSNCTWVFREWSDGGITTNELPYDTDKDTYYAVLASRSALKTYRVGLSVRFNDTVDIAGTRYWVADIRPFSKTVLLKNVTSGSLILVGPNGRQTDGEPLKSYERMGSEPRSVAWGDAVNGVRLGLEVARAANPRSMAYATIYARNESNDAFLLPPFGYGWVLLLNNETAEPPFASFEHEYGRRLNAPNVLLMPDQMISFPMGVILDGDNMTGEFKATLDARDYWKTAPAGKTAMAQRWAGRCESPSVALP